MVAVREAKLSELLPDERNANQGTERGRYMLDHSLRQYGAGRSILVDKSGRIIAGNKTVEVAVDVGLEDVLIVQTDGTKIVAVQRVDLDFQEGDAARLLAYADNRSSEVNLDWDAEQIDFDLGGGLDLAGLFLPGELDGIQETQLSEVGSGSDERGERLSSEGLIRPAISISEIAIVERAIHLAGERNRGKAVVQICRAYLERFGEEGQLDVSAEGFAAPEFTFGT